MSPVDQRRTASAQSPPQPPHLSARDDSRTAHAGARYFQSSVLLAGVGGLQALWNRRRQEPGKTVRQLSRKVRMTQLLCERYQHRPFPSNVVTQPSAIAVVKRPQIVAFLERVGEIYDQELPVPGCQRIQALLQGRKLQRLLAKHRPEAIDVGLYVSTDGILDESAPPGGYAFSAAITEIPVGIHVMQAGRRNDVAR
jgi:hypothetical protein